MSKSLIGKMPVAGTMKPGTSIANKTGGWRTFKPIVDKEKCIGCAICEKFCPEGCVQIKDKKSEINYDYCKGCGICADQCPVKCIKMEQEEK